jgi:hypothetical protein
MDLRERAARAMCILLGEDPDEQSQGIAEPQWKAYLGIADAVLSLPGLHDEAVREERERCAGIAAQRAALSVKPGDQYEYGYQCASRAIESAIRAGQTKESA